MSAVSVVSFRLPKPYGKGAPPEGYSLHFLCCVFRLMLWLGIALLASIPSLPRAARAPVPTDAGWLRLLTGAVPSRLG